VGTRGGSSTARARRAALAAAAGAHCLPLHHAGVDGASAEARRVCLCCVERERASAEEGSLLCASLSHARRWSNKRARLLLRGRAIKSAAQTRGAREQERGGGM
jgi:hypothetical protein